MSIHFIRYGRDSPQFTEAQIESNMGLSHQICAFNNQQ